MNPQPVKKLPRIPITNPEFKYTPAHLTDVRKTFKKFRDSNMLEKAKEVKDVGKVQV